MVVNQNSLFPLYRNKSTGGLKRNFNQPTIDNRNICTPYSSFSMTGEFWQFTPWHSLQDAAQFRPAFLQEQRSEQSFLHAHLTIFSNESGAAGISVLMGDNFPSVSCHPQLVGSISTLLKLIHTFIWWYTLRPWKYVALSVGGSLAGSMIAAEDATNSSYL